jgi:hypothetical protein
MKHRRKECGDVSAIVQLLLVVLRAGSCWVIISLRCIDQENSGSPTELAREELLNLLLRQQPPNTCPPSTTPSPLHPHWYRHAVTDNQEEHCVAAPPQCRCSYRDASGLQVRDHRCGFISHREGERAAGERSPLVPPSLSSSSSDVVGQPRGDG